MDSFSAKTPYQNIMTSVGECVVIGNKREQNTHTRTLSLFKDFVIYGTKMLIILKN